MTDADIRQLRRALSALRPGTPRRFLYCPAGSDGFPVFRVARRIPTDEVSGLLRFARDRRVIQGSIAVNSAGRLRLTAPDADDALLSGIAAFFSEPIPMLSRDNLSARKPPR